ncbi:hypothetical protein CHLRE_09g414800v5 [Chlamydomonas reinhardtii]|uniref:Carboxypeptidase n=1 Tax=Chlamydomonas reinhardtii TaxID=3055 RepID=A0A2K3DFV8_CHLRE|nr:uncharacterized protein CHLRE_09g414800v5 [Chlamydomonas reinhardtii]XP_042921652.1 uncharacterized protein CHLRE_09g414800v5 [Chlamydomonas reinhardtii]PNW79430.1 hypothetical protein CHLRE_09g414800v5 [Chlamydomonas reinhardtii]PNW79431.1 hypothetical protein CHLRE_09g414800v5 [Chlamydomonas reinhardtii]
MAFRLSASTMFLLALGLLALGSARAARLNALKDVSQPQGGVPAHKQIAARLEALRARPDEYSEAALDDLVPHLPGWGSVDDFNLFAGYVTVDEEAGRALFYVLAEAVDEPPAAAGRAGREGAGAATKPLLLWLNGGPGCSSLGGGFMTELGPFYPQPGGRSLEANPHAWNAFASVLWIESPAFVGFSYSNSSADAIVGDARTAADSRQFLLGFLERFPRFRDTPFYISGESYAGHYVPNLAADIVDGNKAAAATGEPRINLQGFLVGNPWTDAAIDNLGAVDYWWSHALVSDQTAQGIRANCNFTRIGPLDPHPAHANAETRDELCDDFCNKAFDELGNINIYEIYADMCTEPRGLRRQVEALSWALGGGEQEQHQQEEGGARRRLANAAALSATAATAALRNGGSAASNMHTAIHIAGTSKPLSYRAARRRWQQQQQQQAAEAAVSAGPLGASGDGADPGYDPCVDDEAEAYLNLPEVQAALHANQTVKLPWRWTDCTRSIVYSREDLLASMLPTYQKLLTAGLRMLVFSGDVDGIVPVVGTRRWVASLRLKEKSPWRPWTAGGQVGGYVVEYAQGLTFATVRGAGHMVPYVQPARAAKLARSFLEGKPL